MRHFRNRFFEEFFLYSSQLVAFFVMTLFLAPSVDATGPLPLVIVASFLVIQLFLLAGQGHNPALRFLFSFITPAAYSLVRLIAGDFMALEMANVFLWGGALYVGLFQSVALASRGRWVKRLAEALLALGAVLVFLIFYFYLDLRIGLSRRLGSGEIDLAAYRASLGIRSFPREFIAFLRSPQQAFLAFGAASFGFLLLANKVAILGLRSRLDSLFAERLPSASAPQPGPPSGEEVAVVVLSADIRDFTGFAAQIGPARAVDVLNRYYALWSLVGERHRGRIAGLSGDTVLAVFGLLGEKDAADRACACAFDFLEAFPGLIADLQAASLPVLEGVSVGIHAGSIVAGDLGLPGEKRLGVFGDAISVAARLDSLCREFQQELLLSHPVFRRLSLENQARFLRLGEVLLRNSTQPVPVYGLK